jgi:hypothetical protein
MRIVGLLGLLLALAVVGLLVKNQMRAVNSMQVPMPQAVGVQSPAEGAIRAEGSNVREQSQSLQKQVGQAVDAGVQSGVNRLEQADSK